MNLDENPTKVYRIVKYSLFLFSIAFFLFAGSKLLNDTIPTAGKAKKLPIYCVDTEEKKVALSFDAAWGNEDTRNLLSILKKHNVKVTFFMTGEWMNKYPDDVKAILADGHDLGNHSENHKQMSQLSAEQCRTEIQKAHDRIKELTGVEMNLFRPPYGDYNNTLVDVCKDMGYHCVQWDIDSLDWKDYGSDAIIKKVLEHKHLGNGSIILMHNGAKYTPAALEAVILGLKEKGYELVPISELIHKENYEMDHEGRQHVKEPSNEIQRQIYTFPTSHTKLNGRKLLFRSRCHEATEYSLTFHLIQTNEGDKLGLLPHFYFITYSLNFSPRSSKFLNTP